MNWTVIFHDAFEREFDEYPETLQDRILARAGLLEINGPQVGRPIADTLKGSRHANMKELRLDAADGAWRVAFISTGLKTSQNQRCKIRPGRLEGALAP